MAAYGIKNGRILKKKQLHMQLLTLTTFKEIRSPHRSNASWRHLFFLSFGQKYIVEKGLYSLSHTGIHHPLKFLSKPDSEEGEIDHFLRCPSYFGPLQGGKADFTRVFTRLTGFANLLARVGALIFRQNCTCVYYEEKKTYCPICSFTIVDTGILLNIYTDNLFSNIELDKTEM